MSVAKTVVGLAIFVTLSVSSAVEAAVIDAVSCARTAVGAAVALAAKGDTVRIPAGTCTWTSKLQVTGITIIGAGIDQTILIDGITRVGEDGRMFEVSIPNGGFFRLTGVTIRGDGVQANATSGTIVLAGCSTSTANYRIDHNKFYRLANYVIRTWGSLYGVIDHNVGTENSNRPLVEVTNTNYAVAGVCGNDNGTGDTSWTQPTTLGTIQAHYVEDNTWTVEGVAATMVDCVAGARIVVRYNTLYNSYVTCHGTETSQRQRGARQIEIYNNNFIFPQGQPVDSVMWFRSGTGTAFNNKITADVQAGLNSVVKTMNLRDAVAYAPWGQCSGSSPYDGNEAGQNGYRCIDQPGAGTSIDYGGINPPPAIRANNVLDPIYVWNNMVNGSVNNCGTYGCSGSSHVKVNRDIYFTERPGYSPYMYPHPLVSDSGTLPVPTSGTASLPAPTNLNVR